MSMLNIPGMPGTGMSGTGISGTGISPFPNVKTSKLLSTKLHSGSVKYAVIDPKGLLIVSVGTYKNT